MFCLKKKTNENNFLLRRCLSAESNFDKLKIVVRKRVSPTIFFVALNGVECQKLTKILLSKLRRILFLSPKLFYFNRDEIHVIRMTKKR
jgi:hypothetical protein